MGFHVNSNEYMCHRMKTETFLKKWQDSASSTAHIWDNQALLPHSDYINDFLH